MAGELANTQHPLPERLGIVGSGTIARGLAAVAARHGPVILCARSESSARRARGFLDSEAVEVTCERGRLAQVSFLVEAIVEERVAKAALFAELGDALGPGTGARHHDLVVVGRGAGGRERAPRPLRRAARLQTR